MAIREESFRIGAGRYLQGVGYLNRVSEEALRLGTRPFIIGGKTALSVTESAIKKSLDAAGVEYEMLTYTGTCNDESAEQLAKYAKEKGYDVIVGVGGGVIMDFAKLCAHFSGLPILNVPTSSATCAAYTPLSVRYTKEGRTVGAMHYKTEVDAVLVDSEVISGEPTRLFLAGVFDALAKFVEIKHRFTEDATDYPLGLDYAYAMAKRSFTQLEKLSDASIEKMKAGVIDADVENVIFSTVAVPGIISGVARGSNQTALGHKFYEGTRFLFPDESAPYLHGEIVGVGLLMQNYYNGEEQNNELLLSLMKKHNMPYSISGLGIPRSEESLQKYYGYIVGSSAISKDSEEECRRFRESLEYLWSIE